LRSPGSRGWAARCGRAVGERGRVKRSFLQSAFAFSLDLRESTLAILISAHCGTRLLDLVWKPFSPPRSAYWVQEQPGNPEKRSQEEKQLWQMQEFNCSLLSGRAGGGHHCWDLLQFCI